MLIKSIRKSLKFTYIYIYNIYIYIYIVFAKELSLYEKKPPAGLHHTEDRAGDAPKHPFSITSIRKHPLENDTKSEHQPNLRPP